MQILSSTLGKQLRPRLACELRPECIVAAAGASATGTLREIAWEPLPKGAFNPNLNAGNLVDGGSISAAINTALTRVADGGRDATLIVPDVCVRVLLVDFDSLPSKQSDVLPVVSFRLKKLLPFDVEHAALSYQIVSSKKNLVRVLAVAIQKELLVELESVVRAAGYEPGAVLPSTLASLAALDDDASPTLFVNTTPYGVTTAIVHAGELQLHRTTGFSAIPQEESNGRDQQTSVIAETASSHAVEVVQTVNIVSAWSEDTLGTYPGMAYAAGSYPPAMLQEFFGGTVLFHDVVNSGQMLAEAATSKVARHWLAGVAGALRTG